MASGSSHSQLHPVMALPELFSSDMALHCSGALCFFLPTPNATFNVKPHALLVVQHTTICFMGLHGRFDTALNNTTLHGFTSYYNMLHFFASHHPIILSMSAYLDTHICENKDLFVVCFVFFVFFFRFFFFCVKGIMGMGSGELLGKDAI